MALDEGSSSNSDRERLIEQPTTCTADHPDGGDEDDVIFTNGIGRPPPQDSSNELEIEPDEAPPLSNRKLVFGILLLLLVDVIWVASSELTEVNPCRNNGVPWFNSIFRLLRSTSSRRSTTTSPSSAHT